MSTSTVAQIGDPFYTLFHATTTDALAEGTTNLYFTPARAVSALTGQNISIFINNSGYLNNAAFDTRLSATTSLPNLVTLGNLSLPATQLTNFGTPFYTYFHATTTDALAQGSTNLYWSNTLFDNRLSATTTLHGITTLGNLSTLSTALTGVIRATAGALSTSLISLASDVTGILPVGNGGTGVSAIQSGFIPFGNGTGAVATSSALYFNSVSGFLGIGTAVGTDTGKTVFVISSSTSAFATTTLFSIANTGDVTINGSSGSTCTIGNGSGGTSCTSDENLKTNITLIVNPLESIEQIRGVTFNWKDPSKDQSQFIGVIAQDVQKVFPQAVSKTGDYLSVDYAALVAPLIEAVKEIASISGQFKTNLIAWLGNAENGIGDFFAENGHFSNELCVGATCVTETQLKTILQNSGQQSAAPSTSSGQEAASEIPAPDATAAPQATEPALDESTPPADTTVTPPEPPASAAEPVVEQGDAPVPAPEPAPAQ